jgi:glucoamylase
VFWYIHAPVSSFAPGTRLAVALSRPANVHWGSNGWRDIRDEPTIDTGLGFHVASLEVDKLALGMRVDFTWRWHDSGEWQGLDYAVIVADN